jgi:bifunctional UDP-N-acetylglucosamine pyrophosphorylase/glucosamine-1-phosphate N-acetyltransferase
MGTAGSVVVLAAGLGKRMHSQAPKVLHSLCGRPMLGYVLDQAFQLEPERVVVVVGHAGDAVREWVRSEEPDPRVRFVTQEQQLGTGHAVRVCLDELGESETVVVLYGDMPLLRAESLHALCAARQDARAAIITAHASKPRGFGRILREGARLRGIVEERDATPEQRRIDEVNVGVYALSSADLRSLLPRLTNDNAQGEYYLTQAIDLILAEGGSVATHCLEDEDEFIGINSLAHLAEARQAIQARILEAHLEAGVLIEDPLSTFIDHGVEIGVGTHVLPCTVIRKGVRIGAGCEVGPFSHLRTGTVLEDGAEIGNFTETKKAHVGPGTKAKHLSYLGDVTIGAKANIGAGTIVANYDGKAKHHTQIADRAFIGSGSILVAPCEVGEGAQTGGGAVIRKRSSVPAGETWVGVPAHPLRKKTGEAGGSDGAKKQE